MAEAAGSCESTGPTGPGKHISYPAPDSARDSRPTGSQDSPPIGVTAELHNFEESTPKFKWRRDLLDVVMENAYTHLAYLDRDFNFIRVNSAYAASSGFKPGELTGRNHFKIHPDPRTRAMFEKVRDTGKAEFQHDWLFRFPNQPGRGVTYWDWLLAPVKDSSGRVQGLVYSLVETTARREMEEALRENEKRFRGIVENAFDGVWTTDMAGRTTFVNRRMAEMIGYSREEMMDRSVNDFMRSEDALELQNKGMGGDNGPSGQHDLKLRRRDGSELWVTVSVVRLSDSEGKQSGYLNMFANITERKKMDELKDEFIGMVSHEMRTPLTVVIGGLKTVLSEWGRLRPDDVKPLLEDACAEADNLSHILNNLLDLSRSQAGKLVVVPQPVDVRSVVERVLEALNVESSHKLVIDLAPGLPHIHADQLRLERVLYNLVHNAIKYSPSGSTIRVFVRREGKKFIFGVSDQGRGLTLEEQGRLFGAFERLEPIHSEGSKGTGLGLLLCRRLVEAHGGRIWIESEPGKGSTFLFSLPAHPPRQKQDRIA
jgi:PAS domain S-box-containing protein